MSEQDELRQQAEQLRASGALGKPGTLSRLFDFLLERSLAGEAPKELEIALQVFGKSASFDVSQDSVVRVYMHKLRRRLDDAYVRAPASTRIVIPKGEYRLTLARADTEFATELPIAPAVSRYRRWLLTGVAMLIAALIGGAIAFALLDGRSALQMRQLRASAVWAPLLDDDLPITIVVGDYYLIGETDESGHVRRLVREFHINSADDFMYQVEESPALMARYRNLGLSYLPTATAFALQDIVPILGTRKRIRVVLNSELDGNTLKTSHILYIGFISGLGMLGDPVFAGSRLSPGGTYDELVDLDTDTRYVSSAGLTSEGRYADYGYFSTFAGPDGNRVVILAGTRDTGVMQMAEALTQHSVLGDIERRANDATSFEALYEVYGMARASTNAKLLFVSPLRAERVWDTH